MSEYQITCPHQDCDDVLILQWHAVYNLSPSDLAHDPEPDRKPPNIDMAHTETWSVECAAGHVLLLPGPSGCPCDDPEGPDCTHNPDDFDWSDDTSIFRAHDFERLRDVLVRIGGAS